MQTLDLNELATLTSTWWNPDGSAAEPSAITLTITKPDGTTSTVLKAAMTGGESVAGSGVDDVWPAIVTVDQVGVWRFVFDGTVAGSPVTQPEQAFLVGVNADSTGLCEPWCTWDDVVACADDRLAALTSPQRESAIDQASEILFDLTGRVYSGICDRTVSLCYSCASCGNCRCHCTEGDSIDLGRRPVWAAWDVIVDGTTLAPSAFTITGRRFLTRLDGRTWPRATDVADPAAFRATLATGVQVPSGGVRAAALFAAEIAKPCLGLTCQIPQHVTSVAREGVTYTILDSLTMIADGRTGVSLTDLWVVADRKGRRPRPGMFSPALAGRARRI